MPVFTELAVQSEFPVIRRDALTGRKFDVAQENPVFPCFVHLAQWSPTQALDRRNIFIERGIRDTLLA
jgi:hypothetical protein